MAYITNREQAKQAMDDAARQGISVAIFCTGSFWNVEAILRAADRFAANHNIKDIPVAVAMTSHYNYMEQTKRVTRSGSHQFGLKAALDYCRLLTEGDDAPYANVSVLPHLDHADPVKDKWELTEGLSYFASVMFDAQQYPLEENIRLTAEYVQQYGDQVLVEGALEGLSVGGTKQAHQVDNYVERAERYVKQTQVDFLVADLGTEQQSAGTDAKYLKGRAQALTECLGKPMLVLHGTSSLTNADIKGFSEDGVVRVNMWTRIVREAGQYAAKRLCARMDAIDSNDFEACESRQYIEDNIDKAEAIMYDVMASLNYGALAD